MINGSNEQGTPQPDVGIEPVDPKLAAKFLDKIGSDQDIIEKDPPYLFAVKKGGTAKNPYVERVFYQHSAGYVIPVSTIADPEIGSPEYGEPWVFVPKVPFTETTTARFCPQGTDFVLSDIYISHENPNGLATTEQRDYVRFDSNINYLKPDREYKDSELNVSHPGWGTFHIGFDDQTGKVKTIRFDPSTVTNRFSSDYRCVIEVDSTKPQVVRIEGSDGTLNEYTQNPDDPNIRYKRIYRGVNIVDALIPKVFDMEEVMAELARPETLENPYTKVTRSDESWRKARLEKIFKLDWQDKPIPLTDAEKQQAKEKLRNILRNI